MQDDISKLSDKELLELVLKDGKNLKIIPERLRDNEDFMTEVVLKNPLDFYYASSRLQSNRDLVLLAVSKRGFMLKYASEELKGDKEIAMIAVKSEVLSYSEISDNLKNDIDILTIVLPKDGNALKECSLEHKNNKELVLLALAGGAYYCDLSSEMQEDYDVAWYALNKNESGYRMLKEKFREDFNFIEIGLKKDILNLLYVPEDAKNSLKFLDFLKVEIENKDILSRVVHGEDGHLFISMLEDTHKICMQKWKILDEQRWLEENMPKNNSSVIKGKKF